MKIENSFEVGVPPERAWPLLTDVERVAPCLPGARLTGVEGKDVFKGEMKVKLGPVAMTFVGDMAFVERDDTNYCAIAKAKAREARNRGTADANISFQMHAVGGGSRVDVVTDLTLAGPAAQYGRGAGMIAAISEEMIEQFAQCLRRQLDEQLGEADSAAVPASPGDYEDEPAPHATGDPLSAESSSAMPSEEAPDVMPASGLALLWRIFRRSVKNLFGAK